MTNAKSRKLALMILTILLLSTQGCRSPISGDIDLLALEKQRYAAIVRADVESLNAILDDNMIFTHASGKIDSKESFITRLSAGDLTYNKIDIEDVEVRLYDSFGIVTGSSLLDVNVRGESRKLELLFMTVWIKDQHGWKVAAYQSTRKP